MNTVQFTQVPYWTIRYFQSFAVINDAPIKTAEHKLMHGFICKSFIILITGAIILIDNCAYTNMRVSVSLCS